MKNAKQIAKDIIKHRAEYIEDYADIVWYLNETAEFGLGQPANEELYAEVLRIVATELGI